MNNLRQKYDSIEISKNLFIHEFRSLRTHLDSLRDSGRNAIQRMNEKKKEYFNKGRNEYEKKEKKQEMEKKVGKRQR